MFWVSVILVFVCCSLVDGIVVLSVISKVLWVMMELFLKLIVDMCFGVFGCNMMDFWDFKVLMVDMLLVKLLVLICVILMVIVELLVFFLLVFGLFFLVGVVGLLVGV